MSFISFVIFRLDYLFVSSVSVCIPFVGGSMAVQVQFYVLASLFLPRKSDGQFNPVGGSSFILLVEFHPICVITCSIFQLIVDAEFPGHLTYYCQH